MRRSGAVSLTRRTSTSRTPTRTSRTRKRGARESSARRTTRPGAREATPSETAKVSCGASVRIDRWLRLRRLNVSDDEQLLARPDQAQFSPGDFLDGGRIVDQAAGLVAQAGVVGSLFRDRGLQFVVLMARAQHGQQSSFADESVNDDQ